MRPGEKMSPKNREFCEGLIHDPKVVRTFLRQHVLYQDRAKDIMATDKPPLPKHNSALRGGLQHVPPSPRSKSGEPVCARAVPSAPNALA